ncbi:19406_t:CDS:1 [Funneliformis geosporum]|uniref:10338_t:CDS:1 n=1 Tax=Funneliformis geosporum TaxID=1117311 RepID=A0A9W4SZ41_9GLOM|nr:19406_t:CDS:1 [Funneliformis geosporum]CAI2186666.1 10338_t:CDS:1 [Funneliformis geosporum]
MTTIHPTKNLSYSTLKVRNKSRSTSLPTFPSPLTPPLPSELPSDPKRWSSSHVAAYLTYCLRLHPPAIISDLARFVEEDTTLTGRKFLRLKEEQLRQMHFNERWIKLIMIGIKELRREHLKGKILLNGSETISEETDEMEIKESGEESHDERPLERNSSISTTDTLVGSFSNNDFKDFFVPTSFSNLSLDDKEFICHEFTKLKEFLKSDIENINNIDFNELNQLIEKAISNIEMNQKDIKKTSITKGSLLSFKWLDDDRIKNSYFGSNFVRGFMIGGAAVWAYMKFSK